jgi:hypothetical protein
MEMLRSSRFDDSSNECLAITSDLYESLRSEERRRESAERQIDFLERRIAEIFRELHVANSQVLEMRLSLNSLAQTPVWRAPWVVRTFLRYYARFFHFKQERRQFNKHFDACWYEQRYPDILMTGRDPFTDFIGREVSCLRDPNSDFDGIWYISTYPDVANAGIHPFIHFILHGFEEGRDPHPNISNETYRIRHFTSG